MTIFRDLTGPWSFIHSFVLLFLFSEFRWPLRRTLTATLCVIGPIVTASLYIYWRFGSEIGGQAYLLVCLLPSACFFYILSAYRDGRYFFTFFLTQGLSAEIIMLSNLLDFYLPGDLYLVMFATRFAAYPLVEWIAVRWLRKPYLAVQKSLASGWSLFALIAALYELLLMVSFNFPDILSERPEDIPAFLLIAMVGPLTCWQIISALFSQLELAASRERESLLELQTDSLRMRIEQTKTTEKTLSIYRHDLRHRLQTLYAMLEKGNVEAAKEYVQSSDRSLSETAPVHWCENPVLDAVFAAYFQIADSYHIQIEQELDIPKKLSIDETELSTVFANAIENAIHATKDLPRPQRIIRIRCVHYPQLMFRVANPFDGELTLDEGGLPTTAAPSHGIGVRSIAAYCEKHGANCSYRTEDGWLVLTVIQA